MCVTKFFIITSKDILILQAKVCMFVSMIDVPFGIIDLAENFNVDT